MFLQCYEKHNLIYLKTFGLRLVANMEASLRTVLLNKAHETVRNTYNEWSAAAYRLAFDQKSPYLFYENPFLLFWWTQ